RMTKRLKQPSQWKKFLWRKNNMKKSRNFLKRFVSWKLLLKTASRRRRRFAHVSSRRLRVTNKKSPRSKPSKRMTKHLKQPSLWKKFLSRKNYRRKSGNFLRRFVSWKLLLKTASRR
ncbi:hypothetical protein KR044_006742, partial [Drosophila immigrans]